MNTFYENIGPTILNPIDMEEAEKTITVEKAEIEEHRSRYGTFLSKSLIFKTNIRNGLLMQKRRKVKR